MSGWWDSDPIATPQQVVQAQAPDVTGAQFGQAPMPAMQPAPQAPPQQMAPNSVGAQIYAPRPQQGGVFDNLPRDVLLMAGMLGPQQGMQFLSPFLSAPPVEVMGPNGPMFVQRQQAFGMPSPGSIMDIRKYNLENVNKPISVGADGAPSVNQMLGQTPQFLLELAKGSAGIRNQQSEVANRNMVPDGNGGFVPNTGAANAAAGQDIAKKDVDQLMAARGDMQQTIAGIKAVHTARELLDKGIVAGSGAEWRLNFGNALKTYLGIDIGKDAVSNTQAYMTSLANQISQNLQALRPATDKDVLFAKQMAGGNIDFTPEALRKILDIGEAAAREKITSYQRRAAPYQGAQWVPAEVRENLRVDMPPDYVKSQPLPPATTVPMPGQGGGAPWKKWGR